MRIFPRTIYLMPWMVISLAGILCAGARAARFGGSGPRHAPRQRQGEPVNIAWTSIKRISNGLTQPQAVAAWKPLHKNELCETCYGDRLLGRDTSTTGGRSSVAPSPGRFVDFSVIADCQLKNRQ
jgi:hypothetical protein